MRKMFLGFLMVLLTLPTLITPTAATAQAGGSRQLANGQALTWTDFYELDQTTVVTGDGYDIVDLNSPLGIVRVASTNFPASGAELRNVVIEDLQAGLTLQQVDRGDYDNVSYSLDTTNLEGTEVGIFTLVVQGPNSTLLTMLITPVAIFGLEMEIAQVDVTIGGTGIFQGVDAPVMQQRLTSATGIAAADPGAPTPATTQLPNSVVIAASGVEVRYSNDWTVQSQAAESVQLATTGPLVVVSGVLNLATLQPGTTAMAVAQALVATPDMAGSEIVQALDLENGRKLLVILDRDPTGDLYMIYDITPGGASSTAYLLVVDVATVAEGVDLAQGTIQIGGQPVLQNVEQLVPAIFTPGA